MSEPLLVIWRGWSVGLSIVAAVCALPAVNRPALTISVPIMGCVTPDLPIEVYARNIRSSAPISTDIISIRIEYDVIGIPIGVSRLGHVVELPIPSERSAKAVGGTLGVIGVGESHCLHVFEGTGRVARLVPTDRTLSHAEKMFRVGRNQIALRTSNTIGELSHHPVRNNARLAVDRREHNLSSARRILLIERDGDAAKGWHMNHSAIDISGIYIGKSRMPALVAAVDVVASLAVMTCDDLIAWHDPQSIHQVVGVAKGSLDG